MPNRRKPNRLKVLEGTDRPDRMYDEPAFPEADGDLEPPDWLGMDGVDAWEDLVPLLQGTRVLTEADLRALAVLCKTYEKVVQKYRAGAEPTAAMLTQLRLQFTEFGLTPASRSKASQAHGEESKNPFADLDQKAG